MDSIPPTGPVSASASWLPIFADFMRQSRADPRAVWTSFSMIIFSEIGDKTFLIAALLSMRHPRLTVFLGSWLSLAVMSLLSSFLGVLFPTLLPKSLTTLLAAALFLVFGIKMWFEGIKMQGDEIGEEMEEARKEIEEGEAEEELEMAEGGRVVAPEDQYRPTATLPVDQSNSNGHGQVAGSAAEAVKSQGLAGGLKDGARNLCSLLCVSPVFAQAFVLTFLGEWGDRSQIATIALAAAHNIWLVSFGTILGHSICTGMAVMGGALLAKKISVKHVTLLGSVLFLLFSLIYLYEAYSEFASPSPSPSHLLSSQYSLGTGTVVGQEAGSASAAGAGAAAGKVGDAIRDAAMAAAGPVDVIPAVGGIAGPGVGSAGKMGVR